VCVSVDGRVVALSTLRKECTESEHGQTQEAVLGAHGEVDQHSHVYCAKVRSLPVHALACVRVWRARPIQSEGKRR
jgi:hypothetical protein